MTFRPSLCAALAALALVLAGCSGGAEDSARRSAGPVSPAFVRLLDEADKAMAQGALADAGRKLDEARSLSPESPDLWLAIARLRLRGGEHLTALEAADRALALGPNHPPALLLRALIVRDAHGAADALIWFEAARKAEPANPDILAEYAATLGDSGQAGAMLKMVRALAEIAPDDPRVPYLQAVLAARGGEYTIARSLLARSEMVDRGVPAALLLDAVISLEEGNADSAAETLETLAARQPANTRVRELLARALLAGGRDSELIRRFSAEAALTEASPYLLMLVARAYERSGDRAAAAPLLARAYGPMRGLPVVLAVRDGLPTPTAGVRRALLAGNGGNARAQTEALRRQFPASVDVASLSGDASLGAGDPQAALTAYALASEVRRPWPLTRKAVWTFDRSGNHEAAELLLMRQIAGETDTASALVALAERQAARGDWVRAAVLLDHAMMLGSGHDPALLRLRLRVARELGKAEDTARFAALLAEVQPRRLSPR
ncbi:tetratricopeptide repeat protein [Porphyrobacter sp. ULC335]|uniref:tetratricopeptide repeat protein n=1 Tax=Porphyrobacter sp. ULC335 TaxID=2854260 RepID=UPI002220C36A|nr:tetratricopeptide repeat protein [Porphyrobacter sp. ULC335]UYV14660.1 tetratricopeptide repeat protein [Porphyrobacter sp. ULC335]